MDWCAHLPLLQVTGTETSHSLEFNIRQLALSDLAANIGESREEGENPEVLSAIDLITSKVETRVLHEEAREDEKEEESEEESEEGHRVFMVRASKSVLKCTDENTQSNSRIHCNIGFAELAVNLPDTHVNETVPVLIDILRDIPYIDFDHCLAWDGMSHVSRFAVFYQFVCRMGFTRPAGFCHCICLTKDCWQIPPTQRVCHGRYHQIHRTYRIHVEDRSM